ncbi:hypothetical protein HanRHA438_Chr14g0652741 [Helianthus annuus]|nr:hypothetical protein HanRHA438_Chr14g0652741 [Helianthus annuus]
MLFENNTTILITAKVYILCPCLTDTVIAFSGCRKLRFINTTHKITASLLRLTSLILLLLYRRPMNRL